MGKKATQKLTTAQRKERRQLEFKAIDKLEETTRDYDPTTEKPKQFEHLPLSQGTIKGLKEAHFRMLTDIQRESIPYSLKGEDVLAAAKTGSGKTLAFLIPVLEKLYRNKWTNDDGLGALIISPTRELAMQIYEVLVKIGKHFQISAGLVIGGKDVKFEMERIAKINILIGTPGRILQHMDQSVGMDMSNLQMLVLDEADRIMDMGFKKTLDDIVSNLPPERQTLLFSATQSKSVTDLARLSLINPRYIGVQDANGTTDTPDALQQAYITVPLEDKLDTLYSFLRTHTKEKIIVFFATSKQVHFVYETFRKMQPGISLMKIHGRQKQTARTETSFKFTKSSKVCLFATDVVARGLDFPTVDWVIQVDAPEDADTYVHRVGRAARYDKSGKSLLFLTPSEEEGFLKRLAAKKIIPNKPKIKEDKKKSIKSQMQSYCFQDPELKYLAQKAFISYIRSVILMKDKDVFKLDELPKEEFARSLGLPGVPQIKIKGDVTRNKELKNASRQLLALANANDDGDVVEGEKKVRTKYDKMFERKNQGVLSEHYLRISNEVLKGDSDESDEEDFLSVKRKDHTLVEDDIDDLTAPTSKRSAKKALSKKQSINDKGNPKKLLFDDDGNTHEVYEFQDEEDFRNDGDAQAQKEVFINQESEVMKVRDEDDKEVAKLKKIEKKRKRQEAERRAEMSDSEDEEGFYPEADDSIAAKVLQELDGQSESDESEDDDDEERPSKKAKWFQNDKVGGKYAEEEQEVLEIEEPETIEDLEALTARLIGQ